MLRRSIPDLSNGVYMAVEWLATEVNKVHAALSLKIFFVDYIHKLKLTTDPAEFLRAGYNAPCFYTGLPEPLENTNSRAISCHIAV